MDPTRVLHGLEKRLDRWRGGRRDPEDPLVIAPYLGYAAGGCIRLRGRVLEDEQVKPPSPEDGFFRNLVRNALRFESDEVPNARLRARFGDATEDLESNEEGLFDLRLEARPDPADGWLQHARLELLDPDEGVSVDAGFIVPGEDAELAIVSDLDDTVLQTGATSTLAMARKLFLGNAHTRVPFEGVGALYEALHGGRNPIFYVSSSPWNIYDVLTDFLEINRIPVGPLLLRDWGVRKHSIAPGGGHQDHKGPIVEGILDDFPGLGLVLIGDSGQKDPEIYRDICLSRPDRVRAVYIRDVLDDAARRGLILDMAAELAEVGTVMRLVKDTVQAAEHAAAQGLIRSEHVDAVRRGREEDRQGRRW